MNQRFGLAWVTAMALSACCETTQLVLPRASALDAVASEATDEPTPFVGLALEENVSGSLDDLEIADGLRVARVEKGSPAEAAGLKRGDLVTKVDGVPLTALDQWQAFLDAAEPGSMLHMDVDRAGAISEVRVNVTSQGGTELPEPKRFAERDRARVVVESVGERHGDGAGARVVEILPGSPLVDAHIEVGDVIREIDGAPVRAASELVRVLQSTEPGQTVALLRERPTPPSEPRQRRELSVAPDVVEVELLEPPRVLTGLGLPILFHFDRDPTADTTEFALVDLWLIALYDYRRQGEARRHRILRWIRWQTGEGTLSEESP
ncbi:MAG: PDZ domain-containing protein [Planctomycetes bacterium]|nr:PDZ domain-containing protein [Planctomycetota bacterium]